VWVGGDVSGYDRYMAPEAVLHLAGYPRPFLGVADIKEWAAEYRSAFPDISFELHAVLTGGDYVTLLWESHQTHTGKYMGIAPLGTRVSMTATMTFRLVDGQVVEGWTLFDPLHVMQQLGVLPEGLLPRSALVLLNAVRRLRARRYGSKARRRL
jgi:predicted ester cyclase